MTHLKTGQRYIFMKNGFQIRIQHPRNSFGAKFSEFFDDFKIVMKIEAHILRGRSKTKTACQPPVVLKSPNLRRSYSIIRLYRHTKGKVHTISPSCSIRGGGYFFKKVPPPLYRRCVWRTYTDKGLISCILFI